MPGPLSPADKRLLLQLARAAVCAAVRNETLTAPALGDLPPALQRNGASFVTLTVRGQLRGCIGRLKAGQPLAADIQHNAAQTALHDYRFGALQRHELDAVEIEISVLTEPQPLPYSDAAELLRLLRPGVDGLILSQWDRRATFLPQVWERVPRPEDFLALLCQKMDLPEDEWRKGQLKASTYQAEKFTEREFGRG